VLEKSEMTGVHPSMIDITYEDRINLTSTLHNMVYTEAVAGNLSYMDNGDRSLSYISVHNFVPLNVNITVNNSREIDPYEVHLRASLVCVPQFDNIYSITFFDGNESMVENNTIVFASGTTLPPLDRPRRIFRRCKCDLVSFFFFFFFTGFFFILFVLLLIVIRLPFEIYTIHALSGD